jgi:hypothetical protein
MSELTRGIASAAMAPVHAVENVAHRIRAFLPFSPAETGPLRDLNRVRIVQTIAETVRPKPLVDAMARVAAAAAIAVPLAVNPIVTRAAIATPRAMVMPLVTRVALTAPRALAAPVLGVRAAPTIETAGRERNVTHTFAPVFNIRIDRASQGVDVAMLRREIGDELHRRGHELFEIWRREREQRQRQEF